MMEREIDGTLVKEIRREGLTIGEALELRYPDLVKPRGHLWWRKQRPVFETPDLYFEKILLFDISGGDKKHILAVGKDEGRLFLVRDKTVLLGGDFNSLNVLATSHDFSRLVVVSQKSQGERSLHLIAGDRIETPFEDLKHVNLLEHLERLDHLLIGTEDADGKKSLYSFDNDGHVDFFRKTVCSRVDDFRLLYYDYDGDYDARGNLLISVVDGDRTVFGVFNPDKNLLREFGIPTPLNLQEVNLVDNNPDFSIVIWQATMDGSKWVFRNEELLAKGAKEWVVGCSPDFSRVLLVSSEEDEARIILNGQEIDIGQARITNWWCDQEITHVVAVLSDGKDKPPRLFYMTPRNRGVLDWTFEEILAVKACKNCIVVEMVRGGAKRELIIMDSQNKQVPGVEVESITT